MAHLPGTDREKIGSHQAAIFERIELGRKGSGDPHHPFEPERLKTLDTGNDWAKVHGGAPDMGEIGWFPVL